MSCPCCYWNNHFGCHKATKDVNEDTYCNYSTLWRAWLEECRKTIGKHLLRPNTYVPTGRT